MCLFIENNPSLQDPYNGLSPESIISSPEPKAQSELIVYDPVSVGPRPQFHLLADQVEILCVVASWSHY